MLVVQISDLHILKYPDPKNETLAYNSSRLRNAIELISALRPLPDVVVVTGDISHEGSEEDYAFCRELLEKLPCPYFLIPGNHDDRNLLRKIFPIKDAVADSGFYQFNCNSYPLQIIGIDTLEIGKVGGELCPARLDWVANALSHSDKPVIILMHHPPYPFGFVQNSDMQCTRGTESLAKMIRKSGRVVAILCGHLHLQTSSIWAGVKSITTPSIAPAFKLEVEESKLLGWCPSSPAFAIHFLNENHTITTHIIRVEDSRSVKSL